MKNSSRLVDQMAQNFRRSSSGVGRYATAAYRMAAIR